jgi:uncharacterized protein YjbJ (UPF0337 family)
LPIFCLATLGWISATALADRLAGVVVSLGTGSNLGKYSIVAGVLRSSAEIHIVEERNMNWDRIEGNWKQVTGKVKEKWGKLTDDDLAVINGKQDQFVGRVQERYGIAKDEAERQVKEWADRMLAFNSSGKVGRQQRGVGPAADSGAGMGIHPPE